RAFGGLTLGRGGGPGRAQPIELRQDGGGLAFVAPAEIGVVRIRNVSGAVLELELAQCRQRRALLLGELLAAVDGERKKGSPAGVGAKQGPEREGQGGHADHYRGDHDAGHEPRSTSRRMRSLIAGSTATGSATPRGRRVQRRTRMATTANPAMTKTSGRSQTRRLNPRRGGDRRIHSP